MTSEPKTPLQLRAENMVREDEALGAQAPPQEPEVDNAIPEEEEVEEERREVNFFMKTGIERVFTFVFAETFKGTDQTVLRSGILLMT
jgi:hypothetical protein